MSSFTVYEMAYTGGRIAFDEPDMIPFDERYADQYLHIYNECYYDMRRALDIQPYNYYSDIKEIEGELVFLLMDGDTIIGSVTCNGSSIDDVIVNKRYQGRGYGRPLLLWAVNHIRECTDEPVTLNVAQWNKRAYALYSRNGFVITKTRQINRNSK